MKINKSAGFQFVKILVRHWKHISRVAVITLVLSVAFSLIVPQTYRGVSTIMPPLEEEGLAGLASMMSDLPLKALGIGSSSTGAETFIAILKSRSMMTAVADSFDLINRYKMKNIELTIKKLRKHVGINLDDEGTITLFAEAETSWFPSSANREEARILARDMANYFIERLDIINRRMRSERARNSRQFIEIRYKQNRDDLEAAEEVLKSFQEEYGIIYMPEQTRATIETGAEIKAQVLAKEIEMKMLLQSVGPGHSEYKRSKLGYDILNREYEQMKEKGGETDIFIPFDDMPELGMKYLQLYREVVLQQNLLEFIMPQYEQAKIQEIRDTPSLQILDTAVKPIRKHRPKRAIIVIFFTFLSVLCSSIYLYIKPGIRSLVNELLDH